MTKDWDALLMHTFIRRNYLLFFAGLIAIASIGCGGSAVPEASKDILLVAEPEGAQDVGDYKAGMSAGIGVGLAGEATIVGRVRSGGDEPWDETQATFLLTSAASDAHDHGGDDHSDCKFCQAKELESMTLVRVVDKTGGVVQTDARKLLGLKEKQVVVAVGQGIVDSDGSLLFDATKIFIRQ